MNRYLIALAVFAFSLPSPALVLVDGDPAARISDVRRIVLVVKNGVVYDPETIQRALGIRPERGGR